MTSVLARHESLPYWISTDTSVFDFGRVHGWLTNSYWAKGIPADLLKKAFENSLSFGLFHDANGQVGCARMITDRTTFAYLADVFLDDTYRGQGLGLWLMEEVMAHPELQGLRRLMLATSNMHPLYRKVGFGDLKKPEIMMEINDPDIYTRMG